MSGRWTGVHDFVGRFGRAGSPLNRVSFTRTAEELGWTPAQVVVAESFPSRLRGMIGRRPIAGEGLPVVTAFPRCSTVHTCFMAYPLDVAFLDSDGAVLALHCGVAPWRLLSLPGASAVLERPSIVSNTSLVLA